MKRFGLIVVLNVATACGGGGGENNPAPTRIVEQFQEWGLMQEDVRYSGAYSGGAACRADTNDYCYEIITEELLPNNKIVQHNYFEFVGGHTNPTYQALNDGDEWCRLEADLIIPAGSYDLNTDQWSWSFTLDTCGYSLSGTTGTTHLLKVADDHNGQVLYAYWSTAGGSAFTTWTYQGGTSLTLKRCDNPANGKFCTTSGATSGPHVPYCDKFAPTTNPENRVDCDITPHPNPI